MNTKWVTIILGALLFLAPFLSGYSGQSGQLWFSLIFGAIIIILGAVKSYKWAAIVGLVVFVGPWIFGFSGTAAATWSWIIGAATAIFGFVVKKE